MLVVVFSCLFGLSHSQLLAFRQQQQPPSLSPPSLFLVIVSSGKLFSIQKFLSTFTKFLFYFNFEFEPYYKRNRHKTGRAARERERESIVCRFSIDSDTVALFV